MIKFRVNSLDVQSLKISYFDMVVTNCALSHLPQIHFSLCSHRCHKHYIVSVIFIFGESGTRICLAFRT